MREIKFRAWDNEEERFIYAEPVYGFFPSIVPGSDETRYGDVQQYTGLKSKSGVEIYEGDIVTINDDKWVCVYDAPQYWLSKDGTTENLEDTFYSDSGALYEVIGNIYENPELLTK